MSDYESEDNFSECSNEANDSGADYEINDADSEDEADEKSGKEEDSGAAGVELILVNIQMAKMKILKKIQTEMMAARTMSMLLTPKKKKLAKNYAKNQTARSPGLKVILKTIQMTRMMTLKKI